MKHKEKEKKSKCPKNKFLPVPASTVAEVVGCSTTTVKSIRQGKRSESTELGKKIKLADILLEQGSSALIQEVTKIVRI